MNIVILITYYLCYQRDGIRMIYAPLLLSSVTGFLAYLYSQSISIPFYLIALNSLLGWLL